MQKICKAKYDGGGNPFPCGRKQGHKPPHRSNPTTIVEAASEEPIPDMPGLYRVEWKSRAKAPLYVQV
jgi:hypothetical protein